MNNIEQFKNELCCINRSDILTFCELALNQLPNNFLQTASSTEVESVQYNTQTTIGIALELFNCTTIYNFTELEHDIIIAALLLNNVYKQDKIQNEYIITKNAFEIVTLLRTLDHNLHPEIFECICDCITQWHTTDNEISQNTEMQKFVHLCDYLANNKRIEFNLNQ